MSRPPNSHSQGEEFGAKGQKAGRRPKDRAKNEGPVPRTVHGKTFWGKVAVFSSLAGLCAGVRLLVFLSGILGRLARVRPVSVPFVVLSFVVCPLLLLGFVFPLWAPSRRPALFWRYPLGYVSQPAPCEVDCQDAAASSGTSDRCSCRDFGTCIITVMLPQVLHVAMVRSQSCAS